MKRPTQALLTALFFGLSLTACAPAPAPDSSKLTVVSTVFPYYDFARVIGAERVSASLLTPPGREVHSFEPTPLDVITLSEAGVFLYNGGEGELWVEEILESAGNAHQTRLRMMDFVPLLEEAAQNTPAHDLEGEATLHDDHDAAGSHPDDHDHDSEHSHEAAADAHAGHDHAEGAHVYDEHIWTSPVNALLLAQAVCDALSAADPAGQGYYEENLAAYQTQLRELDAALHAVTEGARLHTLLFADRFPLQYFCEAYGLEHRAAFTGCAADTEPSARIIASLIDQARAEGMPAVYSLELSSGAMAQVICETTGAKPLTFQSCQSISRADFEAGLGYLDLMWQNVAAIKEGLA